MGVLQEASGLGQVSRPGCKLPGRGMHVDVIRTDSVCEPMCICTRDTVALCSKVVLVQLFEIGCCCVAQTGLELSVSSCPLCLLKGHAFNQCQNKKKKVFWLGVRYAYNFNTWEVKTGQPGVQSCLHRHTCTYACTYTYN